MFKRMSLPRMNFDLRGALRVFGLLCGVTAAGTAVTLRSAFADAERRTSEIGRELLAELGPLVIGEPQALRVNGGRMFVASNLTKLTPEQAVQRVEQYCHEHSGGLNDALGKLPEVIEGRPVPADMRDPASWLTLRTDPQNQELPQVLCFARSERGSIQDFAARLARFAADGDVAHLGDMRYAIARRMQGGQTQVLAIWSQGSLDLASMFPASGDAPGSDSEAAPRPPGARRLMSAALDGRPYGVRMYETARAPEDVLRFYDQQLAARGFLKAPVWLENEEDQLATDSPSYARAFAKGGGLLLVTAIREAAIADETQVSIVELGGTGEVSNVPAALE
jgi:hypothetical protein